MNDVAEKFIVTITQDGFQFTMQGQGRMEEAVEYLKKVYVGSIVEVRSFGAPVDMTGQ